MISGEFRELLVANGPLLSYKWNDDVMFLPPRPSKAVNQEWKHLHFIFLSTLSSSGPMGVIPSPLTWVYGKCWIVDECEASASNSSFTTMPKRLLRRACCVQLFSSGWFMDCMCASYFRMFLPSWKTSFLARLRLTWKEGIRASRRNCGGKVIIA